MKSEIWMAASLGLTCTSLFVGGWAAASLPSRVATRLGRRGKRRMEALAKSSAWAKLEPVVRWLGVRVGRFVPPALERAVDRLILHAGDYLGLLAQELVALMMLSGAAAGLLGAAIEVVAKTHGLAFLAFTVAGFLAPYFELTGAAQRRFIGISRSLPYAVDLFSLGMSAGLDFPGAVRVYAAKAMPDDPLADEVDYILQMLQLGRTRRAALEDFAERVPTAAVREFVHTVIHAEEKGHPLADALVIQAGMSRMRRTVRAEEEAAKAGAKLIIPLTLVFSAVMLLIMVPIFIKVMFSFSNGELGSLTPRTPNLITSTEKCA